MSALAVHPALPPVAPETPCAHCGLPVGHEPLGTDPYFCCTGCEVVFTALREAGLSDTYYRLRDLTPDGANRRARQVEGKRRVELDHPRFIEEQTKVIAENVREATLYVDGVHCAACVWLLEKLPFEIEGVEQATVDLPRARLTLRFRTDRVALSSVAKWVARFGYELLPLSVQKGEERTKAERALLVRVGVAWALAGNVMLLTFALYSGLDAASDAALSTAARWACFALATPSVFYGAWPFFQRAWASLRLAGRMRALRYLHMDTPIALGILVGFVHSAWMTVSGEGEVWFDSVTVLIAALLTARWLQLRSRRLAGDASERLLALVPQVVRRVRADGTEEDIQAEDLSEGDVIAVPAGEVVPVDGIVVEGRSSLNNAVLTGESRPEPVMPGDPVEAGATNLTAPLRIRARAAGEHTRVGKLLAWLRDRETRRAPVLLLADRIGGYFVLTVLVLAAVTALIWLPHGLSTIATHVAALLIVTCPCALGMATPLAMTVASGRAARVGIFIKSEAATQQLTKVDTVVLDKTGTLTEGQLTLVHYEGDETALALAAALEAHSNHPLAAAFLRVRNRQARLRRVPVVTDLAVVAGQGIRGIVDGHAVKVGCPAWVEVLTTAQARTLETWAEAGHTPVAIEIDGQCAAVLAFGDALRADALPMVKSLRQSGKQVILLSGDHPAAVAAVAKTLGITEAHGSVTPEAKQAFVENLKAEGRIVAMVGDGVNDAAALDAADVGIAVAGGSTPSLVAADVFLTREGVQPVVALLAGADRVMSVIHRNLRLSLGYNVLGAAAAMAGLVTPLVAAIAMPLSSLAVVLSSMLQQPFEKQGLGVRDQGLSSPQSLAPSPQPLSVKP